MIIETVITLTLTSLSTAPTVSVYRIAETPASSEIRSSSPVTGAALLATGFPRISVSTANHARALSDFRRIGALQKAEAIIEGFRSLDSGWDGYSAVPVSDAAVKQAKAFLKLIPTPVPIPKVTLSSEGEIAFYWKNGNSYSEIGLDGDGTYYYFAEINGKRLGSDQLKIGAHPFPEALARSLTAA